MNTFTLKKIVAILFISTLISLTATVISYTSGGPAGYSNAPGGSNCTSCHNSYPLQSSGGSWSNISLSQLSPYGSGTSSYPYRFTLSINNPGHSKIGFQLCVLPPSAISTTASIGTLSVPSISTGLIQTVTSGNRQYLGHTSSGTTTSAGLISWTFNWVPPTSAYTGNTNFYVVINSTNSSSSTIGDSIYFKLFTLNVLPVKWNDFNAEFINKDVKINWSTASEINNNYFEVERSVNQVEWNSIGTVKAIGNSNVLNRYEFIDSEIKNLPTYDKNIFYRIKQIDFDGEFEYSTIFCVNNIALEEITLNNFSNNQIVAIHSKSAIKSIRLIDNAGKSIRSQYESNEQVNLDISGISQGMYFLQIETINTTQLKKILINQ